MKEVIYQTIDGKMVSEAYLMFLFIKDRHELEEFESFKEAYIKKRVQVHI